MFNVALIINRIDSNIYSVDYAIKNCFTKTCEENPVLMFLFYIE